MAVVVPIVAAFASGAAGVAAITAVGATALGVAAGYAMVAGAVLTGVGAITGKKDLMKIGGILSMAGGVGSLINSAATSAASAAATEAASSAATDAFVGNAAEWGAGQASQGLVAEAALNGSTQAAQLAATEAASGAAGSLGASAASSTAPSLAAQYGDYAGTLANTNGNTMALQQAVTKAGVNSADVGSTLATPAAAEPTSFMSELGTNLKDGMSSMGSSLKEGFSGGNVSKFLKDNKELVKVGGDMLSGAFGPESEMVELKRRQLESEENARNFGLGNINRPTLITSPLLARARARQQATGG
jgi:hypothetical protein